MNRLNVFYVSTALLAVLLFYLLQPLSKEELSFFGVAENRETEINYNYSVVVEKLFVEPGQAVLKGDTLIRLYRQNKRENLQDQDYQVGILRAEESLWKEKKVNEIRELQIAHQNKLQSLENNIQELKQQISYKRSLLTKLESVKLDATSFQPLEEELKNLRQQKENMVSNFQQIEAGLQTELKKGIFPYESKIALQKAESNFEEAQQLQRITVLAPHDGLVGTISCKEEEHIPSFRTLLTFYEPHSSLVKGFVHEDLFLKVNIGDQFAVTSLKDDAISYAGEVIGQGSRIVEIPSRLRKMPDVKTYGREVLVKITTNNQFLQQEKVGLRFVSKRK